MQVTPSSATGTQPGSEALTNADPDSSSSAAPPSTNLQDEIDGSHQAGSTATDQSESTESSMGEGSSPGRGEQGPSSLQPPAAWPHQGPKWLPGSRGMQHCPWHSAPALQSTWRRLPGFTRQPVGMTSICMHVCANRAHPQQHRHRWGLLARCQLPRARPCLSRLRTVV